MWTWPHRTPEPPYSPYFSWGWKLEDAKHTKNTKESDSTPSPTNPAANHFPEHWIEAGPSIDSVGKRSLAISRYLMRPHDLWYWPTDCLPYRVEGGLGSITNHLNPGLKPSLGGGGVICTTYALRSFCFSRDVLTPLLLPLATSWQNLLPDGSNRKKKCLRFYRGLMFT